MNKSENISTCNALELNIENYVKTAGGVVFDNDFTTACKKENDGDFVRNCRTIESNSSFPSDLGSLIKCNPCNSAYSCVLSNNETSTKAQLIQMEDHQVFENSNEKDKTFKDCPINIKRAEKLERKQIFQ